MPAESDPTKAEVFGEHSRHLHAVAYRILGSTLETEDAVQEARIRWWAADTSAIANPGGWLTTVVARVCLDILRTPYARRVDGYADRLPDPLLAPEVGDPEVEALSADALGRALSVVLESLSPAERIAVVLHDSFAVPFDEIAVLLDRSVAATKQLASRARRRLRDQEHQPRRDHAAERRVVAAFLAASRSGDFETLVGLLHPDVVLRVDEGSGLRLVRGATAVAGQAIDYRRLSGGSRIGLVDGHLGLVTRRRNRIVAVMRMQIEGGRIVAADILADPSRLTLLETKPVTDHAGRC